MSFLVEAEAAQSQPLQGVVLDATRRPIAGATVKVKAGAGQRTTDAEGRFQFPLGAGQYVLVVEAEGFRAAEVPVNFRSGATAPVEVVLQLPENRETITVTEAGAYQVTAASATKTPTPLLDVPQAITAISQELIRDQAMQNMADVVRYVPGITMAQGEGHRDAPVLRGNVTTSDFYLNGVRDDVQYLRDLYNVERVEAVKGANALTFGRGGGGGVINRVTKQPQFTPYREISLQGGSFGNRRGTVDLGHSYGSLAAFRLNGVYENSNSFRHDVGLERYGLAPTVSLRPKDNLQVRMAYEYFVDGRTVDRGVPSLDGRPLATSRSTFFGDPAQSRSNATVHLGSGAVEWQLGQWTLRNTTLVGDYDKYYGNIFAGSVLSNRTQVNLNGYDNGTVRRNVFNQTDASGTFRTGRFRHTLLVGTEFGRQRTTNLRRTALFGGSTNFVAPLANPNLVVPADFVTRANDANNDATNHIAATFVQDQVEINKYLQVVAGVRFERFTVDVRNRRNGAELGREDNLAAPRLGVVVKPVANLSLYGSYSVSFLPSAGDQFSSLSATESTLRPERFNNYEVGAKYDWSRRLSLTAALYRLDRNNATAVDPNNPGLLVQTGSQRTNGLEIGIQGSVTRRWQISGGFAAQDAFIVSATTAAPAGRKVPLVPNQQFSLWNQYRLHPRWSVGLGAIYQAPLFATIDNRVSLPAFTRWDLANFFQITEGVRFQANIENLFNRTYFPTAHNNNNILPGAPFTLRLGLVASF
ncbi:MAG: TonB-dependent siderophore receptor [Bryobacter sp.]|nr:TonB-dependent siderophore receptor [Bryobacter sp.]